MKLEWTIQYGRLVADRFESMARNVKYVIEPDEKGWGAKAIRVRDGMKRIDHTPTRMPLQELVEWCEEDAERPAECPPQPIEPGMPTAETFMKMSGETSEFPSTMDASVWASRCAAWFGAFKVPPQEELAPWFDAAILCGLRAGHKAGLCEAESRSPSPPAPEPRRSLEERAKPMSCWPPERLRELQKRVGECEHRIGSTFMAPESNLSGEFVKLNERLDWLQQRTAGLDGPGLKRRMDELEAGRQSDRDAVSAIQIGIEKRLGDLEAGARAHEGSLSFHDKRLEKLEAKP